MALQTSVGLYYAVGVPGQKATPDQAVYTPIQYFADSDGVNVGGFVWVDAQGDATSTAGATAPIGFVERNISFSNLDVKSEASMIIPEGETVTVAVKGDFYAKTLTTATVGQKVYAGTAGGIKTAATGQTVSGYVETSFVVKTAGSANDVIIISNWA